MAEMLPAACDKMEEYGIAELGQEEMQGYERKDGDSPGPYQTYERKEETSPGGWGRGPKEGVVIKQENGSSYPQGGPLPPFMN